MSRLEELISELCPDGVEYKKLGDIATIFRGGNLQKKDFTAFGIPCIHYGQIYTRFGLSASTALTFIAEEKVDKQKYANVNDIIMAVTSENIEDVCKCVAWLGTEPIAVSGHTAIIHHEQNPKFLAYYFHSAIFQKQKLKLVHGTKVMEVTPSSLNDIMVPIPPLPIQEEIVCILDQMTEATNELKDKLQHELEKRKKQYEYYSRHLLNPNGTDKIVELNQIADIYDSLHQTPKYSDHGFYMIRVQDIKNGTIDIRNALKVDTDIYQIFTRKYKPVANDIVVSRVGSYGNFSFVPNNDCCLGQNIAIIHSKINYRYLFYVLNSEFVKSWILKNVKGASQKSLSLLNIKQLPIPIRSDCEEQRIVDILDHFDTLYNDLTNNLSTEIVLRQKQYEYYRDKLLTFKEKKA